MGKGAPKGHPRYGGRQKGTLNKKTADLVAVCEKHGVHPFEGMVIIAKSEKDPDKKFDKLDKLAQYIYPKPKALEVSDPGGEPLGTGASEALEKLKTIAEKAHNERRQKARGENG